jgi:hypothetical protein
MPAYELPLFSSDQGMVPLIVFGIENFAKVIKNSGYVNQSHNNFYRKCAIKQPFKKSFLFINLYLYAYKILGDICRYMILNAINAKKHFHFS